VVRQILEEWNRNKHRDHDQYWCTLTCWTMSLLAAHI
jgi:hypothetical protein